MADNDQQTEQWRIEGRVQGVGYRAFMVATARELDLRGWVRNRTDGTVEALLCGSSAQLIKCYDIALDGPLAAHVQLITRNDAEPPENDGFISKPSV